MKAFLPQIYTRLGLSLFVWLDGALGRRGVTSSECQVTDSALNLANFSRGDGSDRGSKGCGVCSASQGQFSLSRGLHCGDSSLGSGLLDSCAFIRSTQQTLPEHLQGVLGPVLSAGAGDERGTHGTVWVTNQLLWFLSILQVWVLGKEQKHKTAPIPLFALKCGRIKRQEEIRHASALSFCRSAGEWERSAWPGGIRRRQSPAPLSWLWGCSLGKVLGVLAHSGCSSRA